MGKRKSQSLSNRWRRLTGGLVFIAAVLILVALATHSSVDDARIKGELDRFLDPFEIQYRNQGGMLGAYLSYALMVVLGWLSFFIPLGLFLLSLRLFSTEPAAYMRLTGLVSFLVAVLGTVVYNVSHLSTPLLGMESGAIGGYALVKLTAVCLKVLGTAGTYVVCGGLIVVLLLTFTSVHHLLRWGQSDSQPGWIRHLGISAWAAIKRFFSFDWLSGGAVTEDTEGRNEDEEHAESIPSDLDLPEDEMVESEAGELTDKSGEMHTGRRRTTLKRPAEKIHIESMKYEYPGLDLLNDPPESSVTVSDDELQMTARMLKETLETFQISIEGAITSSPGPIITRFEFKPGAGVKVNRIVSLADDLALALKAKRIRIVAPIPGKAAVGVEIPNRHTQSVYLKELLSTEEYHDNRLRLPLALGKTINGKPFVTDLARMPHLLIAGATGSGKSVCMNTLITSLIYKLHPLHIRFVFIDPKMLELSVYANIPHLGRPVITSPKRAEQVLADIVVEMEKRYRRLAEGGVRNIEDYNRRQSKEEEKLPYIVVCVDELADLMMAATSSKVETLITRLAQMARAVGIHLVLATQRPSVDVITGLIKANFPARIAFQVASKVDSRTIIDANGAEKLLGSGDMLFLSTGHPEPTRLHGAYISSEETDKIVEFIKEQGLQMMALEGISQATGDNAEAEVDLGDPLFREACEVVIRHKQGSVSLLQRRLGIGYQRAARLIDKLEQAGVVSPFDGSKARDVIVDQAYVDAMFSGSPGEPADRSS
ncbi:MAG: DNA translocase FtsK 4TM domain-containing protein [Candidatus Zixiibacteriota bacterium]